MTITLLSHSYRVARLSDARVVLVQVSARMWRIASPEVARVVLAGIWTPVVRMAAR